MSLKKENKYSLKIADHEYEISVNKLAKQANGSVLVKSGETVILATATMSAKEREDLDYFPLSVEFEEHYWAAGKIRGSRFMKRKGKPADEAILSGRLIDRSIRPLFPKGFKNDVQVVVNVLSFDFIHDPRISAFIGVSIALQISNIPFDGPLAGVCIGKKDGKLLVNPTVEEQTNGALSIFIAGLKENITMIEAKAEEVTEEDILSSIALAQAENKKMADFVEKVAKDYQTEKYDFDFKEETELKAILQEKYKVKFGDIFEAYQDKKAYEQQINDLIEEIKEQELAIFTEEKEKKEMGKKIGDALYGINKKIIQNNILRKEKRLGGRKIDEIRPLDFEVDFLPRTHGTAVFNRGETQALSVVTLGAPGSELILDGMSDEPEAKQRYMHFYSFPPYSVGECGFFRGPGRREIGHGALAEKALIPMIPSKDDFPYTIIVNTEIMSSDGSTSMASVCGSTLALMDAGVPLKKPVAGVAMGLIVDEKDINNFKVLTDLCANEDFAGHMDFKVAGTKDGITALQMDIKVKGLTLAILTKALEEAKKGRMFILTKMQETLEKPRKELSKYAPRVEKVKINPDKIRDLIGPGGKRINEIISQTKVQIDIEDDGTVFVTSTDLTNMQKALKLIDYVTKEPKVGEIYTGRVVRVLEFGAMVEFLPEKDGLIHVSKLAKGVRIPRVRDVVDVGEKVKVKIDEIDRQGRYNLSLVEKM